MQSKYVLHYNLQSTFVLTQWLSLSSAFNNLKKVAGSVDDALIGIAPFANGVCLAIYAGEAKANNVLVTFIALPGWVAFLLVLGYRSYGNVGSCFDWNVWFGLVPIEC
jgi:hypothetical protein